MDEALKKSGDWPNVAITPGTHTHAATGEHVEQPENTRIGRSRGACRPDNADCEHEPAAVENGAQNGLECDTREKLEEDVRKLFSGYAFADHLDTRTIEFLDRQAAITERELCARCTPYATTKDYLDTIDKLTAERDSLRERLKTQANSFAKLERDNAKLRDTLARVRELVGDA